MPMFFLHLHECGTVIDDEEGVQAIDVADARARAVRAARGVMCEEVQSGRLCLSCCIVIEDELHHEVGRVPFRDVLTVSGF